MPGRRVSRNRKMNRKRSKRVSRKRRKVKKSKRIKKSRHNMRGGAQGDTVWKVTTQKDLEDRIYSGTLHGCEKWCSTWGPTCHTDIGVACSNCKECTDDDRGVLEGRLRDAAKEFDRQRELKDLDRWGTYMDSRFYIKPNLDISAVNVDPRLGSKGETTNA